jgi:DNA ligase-1
LGEAGAQALTRRKQALLFPKDLTIEKVVENLRRAAKLSGPGTVEKKLGLISELITSATPLEAKYVIRTTLGELRVGIGEGIVRDAISQALGLRLKLLERAYHLSPDYGLIARVARERGNNGLRGIGIELGRPIKVMLASEG